MNKDLMMLKGMLLEADAVNQYEHYKEQLSAMHDSAKEAGEKSYVGFIVALAEVSCSMESK